MFWCFLFGVRAIIFTDDEYEINGLKFYLETNDYSLHLSLVDE
jgi:hypothetical protein